MKNKETVSRTRNYATIVYSESAPQDWQEILASLHIPALISPLHDRDMTADGEIKKPHYHVIVMFSGVKTQKQAKDIMTKIGGVGAEAVNSLTAYARYLIHEDNPDKAQYSANDVVALSGADYETITYIPPDELSVIVDIIDYIYKNQIRSFARLVNVCKNKNKEWLRVIVLKKTSYFFFQYIKSLAWDCGISEEIGEDGNEVNGEELEDQSDRS